MKALKIIWLFCTIGLLSACTADDITESSGSNGKDDDATTAIAISLDNLLPVNMNSRATVDDCLSQINDLNIRVTQSNGGDFYLYCTRESIFSGSNSTDIYYIDSDMTYIHCNKIAAKHVKKVEVIANYGSDLSGTTEWNSLVEKGDDNLSKGYCVMYGSATSSEPNNEHDGLGPSDKCNKFQVVLKRTRTMLTVKMDGAGLKEGVTITPEKFVLRNVPSQCKIIPSNKIANNEAKSIDVEYPLNELGWEGEIKRGVSLGVHDDDKGNFCPIFIYENMQGEGRNTESKASTKYPKDCSSIEEASKNKTHTYLEIEAGYEYKEGDILRVKGTIVYRFFLGKNEISNFDVERNCYYQFTLHLKGLGGLVEDGKADREGNFMVDGKDASWRVDAVLEDYGLIFEDGTDFNIEGHLFEIELFGDSKKKWEVACNDHTDSWIMAQTSTGWQTPKFGTQGQAIEVTAGGKIQLFLKGNEQWKSQGSESRSRTITIREKGHPETEKTYTLTQWSPIDIGLMMKGVKKRRFPKEYYAVYTKIYIDRINRFPKGIQWGDKSFTSEETTSTAILDDYYRAIYGNGYTDQYYSRSAMDNTIVVTSNSSGNTSPNSYYYYYYYYLPTLAEWKKINNALLVEGKIDSRFPLISAPYWTITTDGNKSIAYTPCISNGDTYNGESADRSNKYPFRLIWSDGESQEKITEEKYNQFLEQGYRELK